MQRLPVASLTRSSFAHSSYPRPMLRLSTLSDSEKLADPAGFDVFFEPFEALYKRNGRPPRGGRMAGSEEGKRKRRRFVRLMSRFFKGQHPP